MLSHSIFQKKQRWHLMYHMRILNYVLLCSSLWIFRSEILPTKSVLVPFKGAFSHYSAPCKPAPCLLIRFSWTENILLINAACRLCVSDCVLVCVSRCLSVLRTVPNRALRTPSVFSVCARVLARLSPRQCAAEKRKCYFCLCVCARTCVCLSLTLRRGRMCRQTGRNLHRQ